jgi:Xaa-Pro aminopeptidase
MGARLNHYCSDQTRSFWVGEGPPSFFRETLELVQAAQQVAIQAVRPGLELQELYHKVKDYFARFGVEAHFTHALGHGIGLETHELPGLGPKSQGELEAGMVITIEPGLYFPEWGGVRWEHMVLVSEDGGHVL